MAPGGLRRGMEVGEVLVNLARPARPRIHCPLERLSKDPDGDVRTNGDEGLSQRGERRRQPFCGLLQQSLRELDGRIPRRWRGARGRARLRLRDLLAARFDCGVPADDVVHDCDVAHPGHSLREPNLRYADVLHGALRHVLLPAAWYVPWWRCNPEEPGVRAGPPAAEQDPGLDRVGRSMGPNRPPPFLDSLSYTTPALGPRGRSG